MGKMGCRWQTEAPKKSKPTIHFVYVKIKWLVAAQLAPTWSGA
jgi:hypothetical protein